MAPASAYEKHTWKLPYTKLYDIFPQQILPRIDSLFDSSFQNFDSNLSANSNHNNILSLPDFSQFNHIIN